MPTKLYKDGCRCAITEYEVREIDRYGDSVELNHFETLDEAMQYARTNLTHPARVVEKHVSRFPAHMFDEPDTFTIIATFGGSGALMEGGWI